MKLMIALILLLGTSLSASALTLKEKREYEKWKTQLSKEESGSYYNAIIQKCGYEVKVSLDEKLVVPFVADNSDASSYCNSALSAISFMCEDAIAKPMIKKNISKVTCNLGEKGKESFKLSSGNFVFTFGLGATNLDQKIREFLENNLK